MAEGTRTHGESRTGNRNSYAYAQFTVAADPLLILPQRAETTVCRTFTIAHVNATHPSSELDVVSVFV